jgi:hypothetical protein
MEADPEAAVDDPGRQELNAVGGQRQGDDVRPEELREGPSQGLGTRTERGGIRRHMSLRRRRRIGRRRGIEETELSPESHRG